MCVCVVCVGVYMCQGMIVPCSKPPTHLIPLPQAFIDDPASSGKTFSLPAKSHAPSSISSDKLEDRIKDELIALGLFDMSEVWEGGREGGE